MEEMIISIKAGMNFRRPSPKVTKFYFPDSVFFEMFCISNARSFVFPKSWLHFCLSDFCGTPLPVQHCGSRVGGGKPLQLGKGSVFVVAGVAVVAVHAGKLF